MQQSSDDRVSGNEIKGDKVGGDKIDARGSQGFNYRPGSVVQIHLFPPAPLARIVAFIIDGLVVFIGPFVIFFSLGIFATPAPPAIVNHGSGVMVTPGSMFLIVLVTLGLPLLYFAGLESSGWQATIGKKLVGLKVTDLQQRRIGFVRASARFTVKFLGVIVLDLLLYVSVAVNDPVISSQGVTARALICLLCAAPLMLFVNAVGYAMAFTTSSQQGLHDKVAGTLVRSSSPPVGD